ncbi:hypothetical protein Q7P35_004252 [Cladosporium inversicolor]
MPGSESHHDSRRMRSSSPTQSGLLETAQRFYSKSYAGDYIGFVILLLTLAFFEFSDPFHQMFTIDDPRIQHPHAEIERTPVPMLFLYALGIPSLILLLTSLILPNRSAHKTHVVLLGLCLSLLTTSFLTDIFKNAIGRPRPDLIARCKPDPSTPHNTLVTISVCTEADGHLLQDGWRSYPSGHSSFAFAGLGWLSLFLASQTHCLRPRASHITVLLCLAPLVGAALIAISRLEDYRHDVFDVVSGSVLGAVVTTFNWRRYFPSLWASDCDEPYEPLETGRRGSGTTKRMRDEEEGYGAVSESERFGIGADDGEDYRGSSR